MGQKVYRLLPLCILLLLVASAVPASTIQGSLYDANLDPITGVLLEIRNEATGTVQQQVVAGTTYQLEVPGGVYVLRASELERGKVTSFSQERIRVPSQGTLVLDLVLMAVPEDASENLSENLLALDDITALALDEPQEPQPWWSLDSLTVLIVGGLLIALVIFLIGLWQRKQFRHLVHALTHHPKTPPSTTAVPLAVDASEANDDQFGNELLRYIELQGGTVSQKALRKAFPRSEASMSALLTTLESRGKIRKERQGRENVIRLR